MNCYSSFDFTEAGDSDQLRICPYFWVRHTHLCRKWILNTLSHAIVIYPLLDITRFQSVKDFEFPVARHITLSNLICSIYKDVFIVRTGYSAVRKGKLEGIWVTLYISCDSRKDKTLFASVVALISTMQRKDRFPHAVLWGRLFT